MKRFQSLQLWLSISTALSLSAAVPTVARADVHLVVEAETNFPLDVGGKLLLELPGRLRINASVGFMPSFYASGYTGAEVLFTKYNQETGDVLRNSLNRSGVGRLHLGWRPLADHGIYIDVGYGFAAFGGGNSLGVLLAKATGTAPPPEPDMSMQMQDAASNPYAINTVLHMLDAEIGWAWPLFWQIELRVAGGIAWTFAASTTVTPAFPSKAPSSDETRYTKSVADYLDGHNKGTITPIITVGLGWRIF